MITQSYCLIRSRVLLRWWSACHRTGFLDWRASRRCLSWSHSVATSPTWPTQSTAAHWSGLILSGALQSKDLYTALYIQLGALNLLIAISARMVLNVLLEQLHCRCCFIILTLPFSQWVLLSCVVMSIFCSAHSACHVMSYNREQVKDVVKMLGQMNALDHIIAVAAEHGIKDIKPLLEVKS